jgi:hypothetical protein
MAPTRLRGVMKKGLSRSVFVAMLAGLLVTFGGAILPSMSSAVSGPSGQVTIGNSTLTCCNAAGYSFFTGGGGTVEPAYNDANRSLLYLLTPTKSNVQLSNKIVQDPTDVAFPFPHPVNVAPIFLPVYPTSSLIDPATLNCAHIPKDNCPDHGPAIADAAQFGIDPYIYHAGVIGHDHLIGVAATGGDFNIVWEPVLVLFSPTEAGAAAAATQHITTLLQLTNDLNLHLVFEVPLPTLDFRCAIVSASLYAHGTPAPTI